MQLKLFIVPSLVIFSLIIAIGFIKPDYDTMVQKKSALEQKQSEAMNIEQTQSNIQSLAQSWSGGMEKDAFVKRYYPETLDQERVVDAMNYLASQSGVILIGFQLEQVVEDIVQEPIVETVPLTSLQEGETSSAAMMASARAAYELPRPKAYIARVTARGTYENLRAFIDRASHMDRISEINKFSIYKKEQEQGVSEEEKAAAEQSGDLEAGIEARFSYLPKQQGFNALYVPIFQKASFDFSPADEAQAWAANIVPTLNAGSGGKPNPFR